MKIWIRANRHLPGRLRALNRKLLGHYNDFGLRSNEKWLHSLYGWTVETESGFYALTFGMTVEVAVMLPKLTQVHRRPGRQRHEAVFAALGLAYMHGFGPDIDVADLQRERLRLPKA
jgi:hypothetical protein